ALVTLDLLEAKTRTVAVFDSPAIHGAAKPGQVARPPRTSTASGLAIMPVEVGGCRVGVTPATLATGEPFLPAQSAATGLGEAKEIRWTGVVVLGKSFVWAQEESGCDCDSEPGRSSLQQRGAVAAA